jgi:DNA-binding IclR family transcriptional regulator
MRKRTTQIVADAMTQADESDPQFVTALARGLDILRAFRRNDPPLANQELARRTGLPKPTVSRVTYTLSRLGYLVYDGEAGRYSIGPAALGLGFAALGALGVRDVARSFMQKLADHSTMSVALGRRDRFSMVYIEQCRGDSPLHLGIDVGAHIRLATSAMGRAWYCGLSKPAQVDFMTGLEQRTSSDWPKIRDGLLQAREDFERLGFVLSMGDWKSEINAVGVPLPLGGGDLDFAMNCGGPSFVLPRERLIEDLGPRLVACAAAVRRAMMAADMPVLSSVA